jgi:glycosyltransferase involved in cell wall biosynthesis
MTQAVARSREPGLLPSRDTPELRGVTFVETVGDGSMDLCAAELARRLPVPTLTTDIYARAGSPRNRHMLSGPSIRSFLEEAAFVGRLRRMAGVVHLSNQHLGRYAHFAGRRFVLTVHDLIRLFDLNGEEPLIHSPNARDRLMFALDYRAAAAADAVIVVSAATGRDVVDHLGVSPERIFVVHNGLDHDRFHPIAGERPLPEPYVLYVGTEQPRKNLVTLLRAMRRIKEARGTRAVKLVKVGGPGGCEAPFRERTEQAIDELGLGGDVHFTGRIEDDELPLWYSHADCVVMPSLYEGFGNPALEAMACGAPIVVSDTPALAEVIGDAGLSVRATDEAALADAISALLDNDLLAATLRRRGLARARSFTWERAAQETLAAYSTLPTLPVASIGRPG